MYFKNFSFHFFFLVIISIYFILIIILISAYFTLAERKLMSSVQRRLGPNVVGFWGLLQP